MRLEKNLVDELNIQLTMDIKNDDYASSLKKKLNERRRTADIKGFRRGMAPTGLIQKLYGDQCLYEAVTDQISQGLQSFIKENELKVIGEPLSSENQPENEWKIGADFVFKFDLGITKPLDLSVSDADVLPYYTIAVSDEAKVEMKKNMLRQMGKFEEGAAAGEEDFVIADLSQDGRNADNTYISVRNVEGEAHALFLGAKPGDQFDIDVNSAFTNETDRASMLKVKKEELGGIDPHFHVEIINVKTFVPATESQETYDALFGTDTVHNSEEFDAAVVKRLEVNYRQEADYKFSNQLREYLISKADVKLPENFLKRWITHINEGKLSTEEIDKDLPAFIEHFRWTLVRDYLMEQFSLKVEQSDLKTEAINYASYQFSMYGMSDVPYSVVEDHAAKILQDESQLRRVEEQACDRKVLETARDKVTLDKKEVSVEEFRAL